MSHVRQNNLTTGREPSHLQAGWSWFTPGEKGEAYSPMIGWSWFIGVTPKGEKIVGHTGSQGGFLCNYVSIPDREILFCDPVQRTPGRIWLFR